MEKTRITAVYRTKCACGRNRKGNRERRTVYPLRSSERNLFLWICDQTGKFIRVQLLLSRPESLGRNGLFQTGR